jgi:beta-lactam-binding protein with PASTA domain
VDFLLVLVVLFVVAVVVAWPLYRATRPSAGERPEIEALEAAKDAKLREIRESELDYRTGKLSDEDWKGIDAQLRAEAADLLRRLDEAREAEG